MKFQEIKKVTKTLEQKKQKEQKYFDRLGTILIV